MLYPRWMPAAKNSKKKEKDFKYLVIVESPAKSKTLTKILGEGYLVKSSVGHIRDLPSKGLGIDVKKDFEPSYEVMSGKKKVVDELNSLAKKAEKVYLASDPDREGEAISWHLYQILNCKKGNISRITFNQITPAAVRAAVNTPRAIDKSLVNAQQARRILDRLVGYKISPILWRKIGGRSAGRVQSIAVRLICEREEEINAFIPEEYWSVKADVTDTKFPGDNFVTNLTHVGGKRVVAPTKEINEDKQVVIRSEEEVNEIASKLKETDLSVKSINTKPGTKNPRAPFKTSTLQRAASNSMGFTVKRTMQVAQQLYEGIKLGKTGDQTGLITYMRTDSQRIAPEALEEARDYIVGTWGEQYYPGQPTEYDKTKKKKKDDDKKAKEQDAHEAIRPTYVDKPPKSLRAHLNDEQYKLYKLIWDRFVTSQMSPMKTETKSVEITDPAKEYVLKASQTKTTFAGYSIVFGEGTEATEESENQDVDSKFPPGIAEGDVIEANSVDPKQHFTEGPPRYNEASLVKTLEELGIGRPSTYAPTIATVVDRKYVEKEGNALKPTKLGVNVNDLLVGHFGRFINVDFTSNMESDLDKIAEDQIKWREMLSLFYHGKGGPKPVLRGKKAKEAALKAQENFTDEDMGFIDVVKKASKEIENVVIETEHKCPKCESIMHLKSSRFGPFLGCSGYPDCDGIVNLTKEGTPAPEDREFTEYGCPDCKESSLVIRYGRYGDYLACITKDCGFTSPLVKRTGIKCPREACEGEIVEKKSRFGKIFYGCDSWSKTECDSVFWYPPIEQNCPDCKKLMMYKTLKRGDKIACSDTKGCGFARLATVQEQAKYKAEDGAAADSGDGQKSVFSL